MDLHQQLSSPDFDSNQFLRQILMKGEQESSVQESIQEKLKIINSLNFKIQMSMSESLNNLNQNTQQTLSAMQEASSSLSRTEEQLEGVGLLVKEEKKQWRAKEEYLQLYQTDQRILRCKHLSQEIEHFENRISKLEEYVRQDKFQDLTHLIIQIQESLRVVRDLSFFEKQKQRIEKFDKLIENYMQEKERELVFENEFYKKDGQNIKCLITLEQYFRKDQEFISQLIKSKLLKEFQILLFKEDEHHISKEFQHKFFPKFCTALVALIKGQKPFFDEVFSSQDVKDKSKKNTHALIYEQVLALIFQDYKEQLITEFTNQIFLEQQIEIYEGHFIKIYNEIRDICPPNVSYDSNFHVFFKELYQSLFLSYKQKLDSLISESMEHLTEKDTITGWGKTLASLKSTILTLMVNQIEIAQCFELGSLIQAVLKSLEKLFMQMCYLIGQICVKKIHLSIPNPQLSSSPIIIDEQQYFIYENKFRWQNAFDLIILHYELMEFFDQIKNFDQELSHSLEKVASQFESKEATPQKLISAFIASKNSSYFKYLQKAMNPGRIGKLFLKDLGSNQTLESKIFKQELLKDSIKSNLFKTFIMSIFKELNNISMFPFWTLSGTTMQVSTKNPPKQLSLLLPEPSEYMRKIGEHFISFIHKLDSSSVASLSPDKQHFYNVYCLENEFVKDVEGCGSYWIGQIGVYILQTLSSKFKKIQTLSMDGEKQMISDILYFKKLIAQFCQIPRANIREMDSILVALVLQNPDRDQLDSLNIQSLMRSEGLRERLASFIGPEEVDHIEVEESVFKVVVQMRKS